MILSEAETNSMAKNVTGCCGKISAGDVSTLVNSHEKLRAIIRCLKNNHGCWCDYTAEAVSVMGHTALCRDISKRVI